MWKSTACVHREAPGEDPAVDYSLDDYFELALDLPEAQRAEMIAQLRRDDPELATRLTALLAAEAGNPDFACHAAPLRQPPASDSVQSVVLHVGDVARAAVWYQEVFRCQLVRQEQGRAIVAFGNLQLHLVAPELQPPGITIQREDVAAFGRTSRSADGGRRLQMVDPWGNAIELIGREPRSP